jgi:hypothetical protein
MSGRSIKWLVSLLKWRLLTKSGEVFDVEWEIIWFPKFDRP